LLVSNKCFWITVNALLLYPLLLTDDLLSHAGYSAVSIVDTQLFDRQLFQVYFDSQRLVSFRGLKPDVVLLPVGLLNLSELVYDFVFEELVKLAVTWENLNFHESLDDGPLFLVSFIFDFGRILNLFPVTDCYIEDDLDYREDRNHKPFHLTLCEVAVDLALIAYFVAAYSLGVAFYEHSIEYMLVWEDGEGWSAQQPVLP